MEDLKNLSPEDQERVREVLSLFSKMELAAQIKTKALIQDRISDKYRFQNNGKNTSTESL